jgi:hypothetical protein
MLLADSGFEERGVTLYRDHLAAATFYYLPGTPRLAADAPPARLLRYRGARSGGLLTFTVELGFAPGVLDSVHMALAARTGGVVNLVAAPMATGTVRLSALGVSVPPAGASEPSPRQALVERVIGSERPSLMGAQRASFSIALDAEGASLAAAALSGGALPLVVGYDLQVAALRPARAVKATVKYKMAYDYLRARVAAGRLMFHADLDAEREALRREGLITLEDVELTVDDAAARAARVEAERATVAQLVQALFFRPAATPAAVVAEGAPLPAGVATAWAQVDSARAAFVMRALDQSEDDELHYDFTEAQPTLLSCAPQAALRLPPGDDAHAAIVDVTIAGDEPVVVELFGLADADWTGVGAIVVDVRSGDTVRSATLTTDHRAETLTLPPGAAELRIQPAFVAEPEAIGRPRPSTPAFAPLDRTHVLIDPMAIAGRRLLDVHLGVLDPELVTGARVRLTAGELTRDLELDAGHAVAHVPVWGAATVAIHAELALASGGQVVVDKSVGASETLALLNQPAGLFETIVFMLQDPLERFDAALIELAFGEGRPTRALRLDRATPSVSVSRPRAGSGGPFRYRVKLIASAGQIVEEGFRDGAGPLVLVGDVEARIDVIDVVILDAVEAASVRLTALAPPPGVPGVVEQLFETGQSRERFSLPSARSAALGYRVDAIFYIDGDERPLTIVEAHDEVLLLSIPHVSSP